MPPVPLLAHPTPASSNGRNSRRPFLFCIVLNVPFFKATKVGKTVVDALRAGGGLVGIMSLVGALLKFGMPIGSGVNAGGPPGATDRRR